MMLRSETTFVNQNSNLLHKCGFRLLGRLVQHFQLFDFFSEIEVFGPRFETSSFLSGLFRGASQKIETTFAFQLLILFHRGSL